MFWGSHHEEYRAFKIKQLGQREYDILTLRANTPGKKDRKLMLIYWTQRLKDLEASLI